MKSLLENWGCRRSLGALTLYVLGNSWGSLGPAIVSHAPVESPNVTEFSSYHLEANIGVDFLASLFLTFSAFDAYRPLIRAVND